MTEAELRAILSSEKVDQIMERAREIDQEADCYYLAFDRDGCGCIEEALKELEVNLVKV